jgi:hypothetical protein
MRLTVCLDVPVSQALSTGSPQQDLQRSSIVGNTSNFIRLTTPNIGLSDGFLS